MTVQTSARPAAHEAQALLDALWVPRFGELRLPVDSAWIAGRLGLREVESALDPSVAGFLIKRPGMDAVVHVNSADSLQRRRFTCAHELGHYVRRVQLGASGDEWAFLDHRNELSSSGTDPEERWANAFAAALVMPEQAVGSEFKRNPDPLMLALRFGVSSEAMGIRLRTTGLVR